MHWLIDGHNLIGQLPALHLDDPNDEEKLLEQLRSFRARTGHFLTVIFDPGQVYHPAKAQKRGGITVQFAPHGRTADQLIIRRLRRVKNPGEMRVVSSDHTVQRAAQAAGVRVISAQEFAQQLSPTAPPPEEELGSEADVRLSPTEIEAWLDLFNQSKQ